MFSSFREDASLVSRLFGVARPYWFHIGSLLLLNLLTTPLALLSPIPLKLVVDNVLGSEPLPALLRNAPASLVESSQGIVALAIGLLLVTALMSQLVGALISYVYSYMTERMTLRFKSQLMAHAQRLSLTYHDSRGTADSVFRIQWDGNAIKYVIVETMVPLIGATATFLSMMYVTMLLDLDLALIALAITPVLVIVGKLRRDKLRPIAREAQAVESSAMSIVQEVLGSLRVVRAFGQEDRERDRFVDRSEEAVRQRLRHIVLENGFGVVVGLSTAAGTALVIWFGIRHVQSGVLTLGNLLLVMAYLGYLYGPLQEMGKKAAGLQGALASAERAFALLDEAPDVVDRADARPVVRALGRIEFREVSFSYEASRPVLKNVSFLVEPGTRVGIAGPTGSGKTTLMHLMTRFYDPSSGAIILDGHDLRAFKLADLRNQFAFVLQEPILFSATIGENIAYGRPDAGKEDVIRAADMANAHDFITCLPEGYDTVVGERGMQLSGGERQRVSLARAFLKDAPILVLDEPTSSVDVHTEALIIDAMQRLIQGRTTFIVAHRLVTLEGCDVHLHLDEGQLRIQRPWIDAGSDNAVLTHGNTAV